MGGLRHRSTVAHRVLAVLVAKMSHRCALKVRYGLA